MPESPKRWDWIFDLVTMIAVLVGLTFGAIELRQIRNAQETATVLQLFETIQTESYNKGTALILQLPDTISTDSLRARMRTPEGDLMQQVRLTFEGLGVMVYRRDVPIEWVDEMFRFSILETWDRFEELTLEDRATYGYPDWAEWHQWLTERLRERRVGAQGPAYEAYRDWTPDA